jgi:hypothetical protein
VLRPNGILYVWEPFYPSIWPFRGYWLKKTHPEELSLGIHHVYHTYFFYQRLFKRWLTAVQVQREFERNRPRHHVTRNRWTVGAIYAEGRMRPGPPPGRERSVRRQIEPQDFLREDLLGDGLDTTRHRKEFLDSLLARDGVPATSVC